MQEKYVDFGDNTWRVFFQNENTYKTSTNVPVIVNDSHPLNSEATHCFLTKAPVTPNGDATAFVQRSKTMSVRCGIAAKYGLNIKFARYSVYTTSSQRPYSVHATFPQRLYSVHDVFTARKQLLQRVHGAHMARTQRPHGNYSV